MLRNPWFHASQKRIKIDFLKYYILRKLKKLLCVFEMHETKANTLKTTIIDITKKTNAPFNFSRKRAEELKISS